MGLDPAASGRRSVLVEREMLAPAATVWRYVQDIERYPTYTAAVRSVMITGQEGPLRFADWELVLRGSILRWSERAVVEHERMHVSFTQTAGDLSYLSGEWLVVPSVPVRARFAVEFEIGIPLLAHMLTPIAAEALVENATKVLEDIDFPATSATAEVDFPATSATAEVDDQMGSYAKLAEPGLE